MKLSTKLIAGFLLVGVIPFLVIGIFSLITAGSALSDAAKNQLVSVRDIKKSQIEQYFQEREGDLNVLTENINTFYFEGRNRLQSVQANKAEALKILFDQFYIDIQAQQTRSISTRGQTHYQAALNGAGQSGEYQRYATIINDFIETTGYYDFFVIDNTGHCIYSHAKEADFNTNLLNGQYRDSGLGKAVRKAMQGQIALEDFSPYAPSNGEFAAFLAAPIIDGGRQNGVVALQINMDNILRIVGNSAGMGKTGESYLVGSYEGKTSFRSNMTTMGDGKYVVGYEISTDYINKALAGVKGGGIYTDSTGKLVLVTYEPLNLKGINWALVSKIDIEELAAPQIEGQDKDFYAKYIAEYGYYDLFLIHPEGHIFYTVTHEADYDTNIINGTYADSGLGKLIRRVVESNSFGFEDFAPYAPSNGDPACFIAKPILNNGKIDLIVALQISLESINRIMQERSGMGQSGETYLIGEDLLMRSDSFLDPENHSVRASFANPTKGSVDTEAAREALQGKTDAKIITDYLGNPVLSAYTPLTVGDTTWALLAEIDESEAFAAVSAMQIAMILIGGIGVVAIVLLALFIARQISNPINEVVVNLHRGARQIASAAEQVAASSQQMAAATSQNASSLEEVSSSLEEMTAGISQNTHNARQADALSKEANNSVETSQSAMSAMNNAIENISNSSNETQKIVKTIDEIAFQTNLLALNAAVEAARAGDAGKGFAVVAEEVRNLAQRSAEAAKTTAILINKSQASAEDGVKASEKVTHSLSEIMENISKVTTLISEVSTASEEQAQGIAQINDATSQMDKVTQETAANSEETASASEELDAQAQELSSMVAVLNNIIQGTTESTTTDVKAMLPVSKQKALMSDGTKN
jgi:methyl-accepting chemotaxis protein